MTAATRALINTVPKAAPVRARLLGMVHSCVHRAYQCLLVDPPMVTLRWVVLQPDTLHSSIWAHGHRRILKWARQAPVCRLLMLSPDRRLRLDLEDNLSPTLPEFVGFKAEE